jgi:hypothetical protein
MNIDKKTIQDIQRDVDTARTVDTYEFECKLKSIGDKKTIDNITMFLLNQKYTFDNTQELDIIYDKGLRTTIRNDGSNLTEYCKTNRLPDSAITIQKEQIKGVNTKLLSEYDLVFSMKNEKSIKTNASIHNRAQQKLYRFKKRYSFVDINVPYLRVDITAVKSSKSNTMLASRVLEDVSKYEVEIEFVQKEAEKSISTAVIVQTMFDLITKLLMIRQQSKTLIGTSEREETLRNYLRLTNMSQKKAVSINLDIVRKNPKSWFVGPQPVTLEQENMVVNADKEMGVFTIYEDYTVTDKADGERMFLYIPKDIKTKQCVYLLSTKLDVTKFQVYVNKDAMLDTVPGDTLLDGEYVTKSITGTRLALFAAFDVYFVGGVDLRGMSLRERLDKGKTVMTHFSGFTTSELMSNTKMLFVKIKDFEFADKTRDIHECSNIILQRRDANEYPYHIDGVIFTPQHMAVHALYQGQPIDYSSIRGMATWKRVFKWKPPHENTIDFLVKIEKEMIEENSADVSVKLFVGYNPDQHEKVHAIKSLIDLEKQTNPMTDAKAKAKPNENRYSAFEYTVTKFKVTNMKVLDDSNQSVLDETIVECRYDMINKLWSPLRTRHDKTGLYKSTGSISGTANDLRTATNVFRTIMKPVEEKYLIDKEASQAQFTMELFKNDMEDEYYNAQDTTHRSMSLMYELRRFHNSTIKETLLITECAEKIFKEQGRRNYPLSIFDVACGKGGDLLKWARAGFIIAIGADISQDNITNQRDGAYARLKTAKSKQHVPKSNPYAFVQMDATKVWNKDYIATLNNDFGNRDLARCLWDIDPQASLDTDSKVPDKYRGILLNKVDVVSCQFALHYFFKDESTANNFLKNVSSLVKKGGYFIGTGLDGTTIANKLKERSVLRGETKENVVLWKIEKRFKDEEFLKRKFGNEIQVYVQSLGSKKIEYLVKFEVLRELMEQYGFELVSTWGNTATALSSGMFGDVKGFNALSPSEQEFSKLNRWFVFQYKGKN